MAEQDTIWKEIIVAYFMEFLAFFYPQAYADIDWSKKPEFLDKELAQITPDSEVGNRLADKLVKVFLLNGKETWVLIHIEVQGYHDPNFAERMYVYSNRIFDLYRKPVANLVIFTDDSNSFRPDVFRYNIWESELLLRYRTVKLLDYRDEWQNLERDPNPFSIVVMAHLKMRELRTTAVNELAVWKFELNKLLYQRGYSKQWINDLYRAIDWLIRLPDELDNMVYNRLVDYVRQEVGMPFITTAERIGLQKGLQEGRQEGLQKGLQEGLQKGLQEGLQKGLQEGRQEGLQRSILRQLTHKFGLLEAGVEQAVQELSSERLEDLAEALLDFQDKTELITWLQKNG